MTDLLEFGVPNLLAVTVSKQSSDPTVNAAERSGDYWVFGGIYRPVYLEAYPPQFIDRTAIKARADGTLLIDAYLASSPAPTASSGRSAPSTGRRWGSRSRKPSSQPGDSGHVGTKVTDYQTWSAETPATSIRSS